MPRLPGFSPPKPELPEPQGTPRLLRQRPWKAGEPSDPRLQTQAMTQVGTPSYHSIRFPMPALDGEGHTLQNGLRCWEAPGECPELLLLEDSGLPPSACLAAHLLTLYTSPAMSMYRLMAAFWYRKQEPCWPHWSCHSKQALSITQPKAMGPGMPPVERGPLRTPTCPGSQKKNLGHWCSQGHAKRA